MLYQLCLIYLKTHIAIVTIAIITLQIIFTTFITMENIFTTITTIAKRI